MWSGRTLYDLYKEAHTPYEWHAPIFELARNLGVEPFSTPFDESAVDFLESLNVERYKIASLEIVDLPLIARVAATMKPIIISTGTASLSEIAKAVETAQMHGANDITALICTSSYPALPEEANLSRMAVIKNMFDVKVGLSDHTLGIGTAIAAVALGASMVEKHVTLERKSGGVDSAFSMEPSEFKQLVTECEAASQAIGNSWAWNHKSEDESKRLRPSLYVTKAVKPGDIVSGENIRSVRLSGGLPPESLQSILGRKFTKATEAGDPVT